MANQAPPVLLFDIMVRTLYWAPRCSRCTPAPQDTVVVDPFYKHMAPFFGLTFQELLDAKHPTAWLEFERGQVDEAQFAAMFFKDGRHVDAPVLRAAMTDAYDFVPGMETLLQELVDGGHQLHACSNYTEWYRAIEGKLLLSRFLNWTFMSCEGPMKGLRKPSPECFSVASRHLAVPLECLLLVDDREANVQAARDAGMDAVHFLNAQQLRRELAARGLLQKDTAV